VWGRVAFIFFFMVLLVACSQPKGVIIRADGKSQVVETEAQTVREVLEEAGVSLGGLDRVEPDLWESAERGMEIRVIRVQEKEEVAVQKVPFERRVIKDEALEAGESRLMQEGAEGEEEVVYLVTYEDGQEVARKVVARRVILEPVAEVRVTGAKGLLPSIPISGTIAYISYGNAWVMHHESGQKRPLTVSGDLDGRVFALSPDGTRLLFTRTTGSALNSLWMVSTVVVGDEPQPLKIEDVRYAEWSPDGQEIAYSTAEKTQGAPGWKAKNDLYILSWHEGTRKEVLPPSGGGIYGWWGMNFAWSPEGSLFAYADADEVGVIDGSTGERSLLISFAPYYTYAEWVWVPTLSWSPDGLFLVTTIHDISEEAFDLWVLGVDGKVKARLVPQVGIWSSPRWSFGDSILFGQAESPDRSQETRYLLYVMDRDGSNAKRLFPPKEEEGLVVEELVPWVWSPWGGEVVVVKEGNVHLLDLEDGSFKQLTIDGGASQPRWAR